MQTADQTIPRAQADDQIIPKRREPWIVAGAMCLLLPLFIAGWMRWRNGQIDGQHHITPSLVCNQSDHDFGMVSLAEAAALSHRFTITNVADHDVNIVKVMQSCGCTKATLSKSVVHRGETATVTAVANWSDRGGRQAASIWLTTDEASSNIATLGIDGYVTSPVVVWPRKLYFGDLDPGPSPEQYFDVSKVAGEAPITITGIRTSGPNVRVRRMTPTGLPGNEGPPGRFGVQVLAPSFKSESVAFVVVSTSVGDSQLVGLQVQAKGAIIAAPESVLFDVRSSSAVPAIITIHLSAGADPRELTAKVVTSCGARRFLADEPTVSTEEPNMAIVTVRAVHGLSQTGSQILRIQCKSDFLDVPIGVIGRGDWQSRTHTKREAHFQGDVK